tara:strand:+ start:313 stop:831 length:519 start_codon:yes stop_codon:yes gene_type:complete
MNIFRLHDDPIVAAQMHCDKHIPKMILETAQMLSTAWRTTEEENEYADEHGLYKAAYKNHPSTVWVRHGILNYFWTRRLFEYLCKEYTYRYGKRHASERLLEAFAYNVPHETTIIKWPLPFPQCMPDQYKVEGNPVQAYRNYYKAEKAYFAKWNRGTPSPEWWSEKENTHAT